MSSELLFQSFISYFAPGAWDLVEEERGLESRNVPKSHRTLAS